MIQEQIANNLFGNYQIISKIAEYSSHTIYLATQSSQRSLSGQMQSIREPVALKVWHSTPNQELFIQHIHVLVKLWHAHIAATLDAGIEGDSPYIVSTFAARHSLRERLQLQAPYPLSVAEAVTIITRIGQAIVYAHKNNVLHGAIKPENIVFNENNEALISDFRVSPDTPRLSYNDIYTYMAPEQLAGQTTRKSDQYALACVAYELLTGYVPFGGTSKEEIQQQQLNTLLVPPRQLQPVIPVHIERALLRALSLRAEYRYPTIDKFIMALHTVQHPSMADAIIATRQDHPPAPSRQLAPRPMPLAATASQDSLAMSQTPLPPPLAAPSTEPPALVKPPTQSAATAAITDAQTIVEPDVFTPIQTVPAQELEIQASAPVELASVAPISPSDFSSVAPAELHAALPIPMAQQSNRRTMPPMFQQPRKRVLLGLACVACIVILATAGMLSFLKTHTSVTPQPGNGVINITVNTQSGKQRTGSATPPSIQHFAATPTAVPTHIRPTATAVPIALFNVTHLSPPGTVDLTNEGQLDWVQWGRNGTGGDNHKANIASQIGSYAVVGGGTPRLFLNSPTTYTWSDGTPRANMSGTNNVVAVGGSGNGFQLTIPANTTARTLRIYVGVLHAQASFTAALSEKNSMIYSDTPQNSSTTSMTNIVYVIRFEATSATQNLTVSLVLSHSYGAGLITLQAASLQ